VWRSDGRRPGRDMSLLRRHLLDGPARTSSTDPVAPRRYQRHASGARRL